MTVHDMLTCKIMTRTSAKTAAPSLIRFLSVVRNNTYIQTIPTDPREGPYALDNSWDFFFS